MVVMWITKGVLNEKWCLINIDPVDTTVQYGLSPNNYIWQTNGTRTTYNAGVFGD